MPNTSRWDRWHTDDVKPLAATGVASVVASSAGGGGTLGASKVLCSVCGLIVPAVNVGAPTPNDTNVHPCFRGKTISINAAGQIALS